MSIKDLTYPNNYQIYSEAPVIAPTANFTLSPLQSGSIIALTTGPQGTPALLTITLPPENISQGVKYRFSIVNITNAFNIVIQTSATATTINGLSFVNNAGLYEPGKKSITYAQANGNIGDFIDLYCDGVSWNLIAIGRNAGVFTYA